MIINKEYARILALQLLQIDAVILRPNEPFIWSSGWNSPIYCDNRLTLRYPEIRKGIAQELHSAIEKKANDVHVVTGTATAGIPHAAWVASLMDKPMAYVRAKAKSYGMGNQIEGGVEKGERTLIIEDLISTGGSAMSVVEALRFIGADITGIFCIFTYGFDKSDQKFEDADIPVYTLTDYSTLIDVAIEEGYVDEEALETLNKWRANPESWPN